MHEHDIIGVDINCNITYMYAKFGVMMDKIQNMRDHAIIKLGSMICNMMNSVA